LDRLANFLLLAEQGYFGLRVGSMKGFTFAKQPRLPFGHRSDGPAGQRAFFAQTGI
jgi:hypothetical protein